jgi:hypothetical protein
MKNKYVFHFQYLLKCVIFFVGLSSVATATEYKLLPEVLLYEQDGKSINTRALQQPTPWALLVVNSTSPSSQVLLNLLSHRKDGYQERLVIVVSGNVKEDVAFIAKNRKLNGVKWLIERNNSLANILNLRATPTLYAINAHNQIAWQLIGTPPSTNIESVVEQWLQLPATNTNPN